MLARRVLFGFALIKQENTAANPWEPSFAKNIRDSTYRVVCGNDDMQMSKRHQFYLFLNEIFKAGGCRSVVTNHLHILYTRFELLGCFVIYIFTQPSRCNQDVLYVNFLRSMSKIIFSRCVACLPRLYILFVNTQENVVATSLICKSFSLRSHN